MDDTNKQFEQNLAKFKLSEKIQTSLKNIEHNTLKTARIKSRHRTYGSPNRS